MTRQDQSASEGATAIQAGGDVVVGFTPAQMAEVMGQLLQMHSKFTADAMRLVDDRANELQDALLKRFMAGQGTKNEAFSDPDFQYMLGEAQEAFTRSGDAAVRDTLVDIVARRSMADNQSREALTLNDAAQKAPKLTRSEFAVLSLCYLVRNTINHSIVNIAAFSQYVKGSLLPFVDDVSEEQSTFWYIESLSLGTVVELSQVDLRAVLVERYGGVLGDGLTLEAFRGHLPEEYKAKAEQLVIPALRNPLLVQPNAITLDVFKTFAGMRGVPEDAATNAWNGYIGTVPSGEKFTARVEGDAPGYARLHEIWTKTALKSLVLNSTGIAIAHANAVRVIKFDAPLSIWIK